LHEAAVVSLAPYHQALAILHVTPKFLVQILLRSCQYNLNFEYINKNDSIDSIAKFWSIPMPSLVVRNLDQSLINALKARAVAHHRSTEAEHRAILAAILIEPQRKTFAEALSSIPAVGTDADFMRLNDDIRASNVFD
jgi:plasmid stability protein